MIINSSGKIFYGMHFYPGLAQYSEPNKEAFKIFLNEDTLRKMDASFAGKPIFVNHVNEVEPNIDELKKEADGWVIESFFNSVDGKHWVKMIIVSDKADRAIKQGYRLSNAYIPKMNGRAGEWNGISYQNEVVDGEYEHLAIVNNPRYDESIIMTPDEFKSYNENLQTELKRIANSKSKENQNMATKVFDKLKFWNKKPVENSIDIENLSVTLPKSDKEFSIFQIVNAMDEMEMKKKEKDDDDKMENKKKMKNKEEETETDLKPEKVSLDVGGDLHNEEDDEDDDEDKRKEMKNKKMKNKEKEMDDCVSNDEQDDDEKMEKDKEMKNKKMKNELDAKKKENFESLKNAPQEASKTIKNDNYIFDRVKRGKQEYGSGN